MKNILTTIVIGALAIGIWTLAILATSSTFHAPKNLISFNQRAGNLISFSLLNRNTGQATLTITDKEGDKVSDRKFFGKDVFMPTSDFKEGVYNYMLVNGKQIAKGVFAIQ